MTFSYNLVLALVLLAPGLGAYAGLFSGVQNGAFRPGAPSPTSVLTLGIIVLGAMFAHLMWALACLTNDFWAACGLPCPLPTIPNAYTVLFTAAAGEPRGAADVGVVVFLGTCCILTAANAWFVARVVRWRPVRRRYMRVIYGWLTDLVGVSTDARVITAFVVTDIQKDDFTLGYEGVVLNMSVNSDKQIIAIVLREAELFYLKLQSEGVDRIVNPKGAPISQIYIEQSRIQNIAFKIFEVED